MAHCPSEKLSDLRALLAEIREWPEIREVKPGIFYLRRMPFLHFHLKDGDRWADVRCGRDWASPIGIPFSPTAKEREDFLKAAGRCYKTPWLPLLGEDEAELQSESAGTD
jgi:hypothetical protein